MALKVHALQARVHHKTHECNIFCPYHSVEHCMSVMYTSKVRYDVLTFPGPVQSTDGIRYVIIHRMHDNQWNVQATNSQNLDQMYIYIHNIIQGC
jgi:hypothetical protein